MHYRLAPGVTFCFAANRAIVLNLMTDRYLGLTSAQAQALRALGGPASAAQTSSAVLNDLVAAGVLAITTTPAGPVKPCSYALPEHSLIEETVRAIATMRDVARTAMLVIGTAWAMRAWSLHHVLQRIARQRTARAGGSQMDAEALHGCARRFLAARRWVPVDTVCLLDSLALVAFLAHHGFHADLVVAVDAAPFEAHAWVQAQDWALNESVLRTRMLTPILVL